ncbi:flagellar motor protein MotB [Leifsonia sp. L25]|uniref:flagellar motor protein MotB n=1 Tax=Leifsonia sp. L25 TaxID=3423957 RepID=UPI003D68DFA3
MSARRRKKHEEPEEHENEERWMASYMDMVTVLMCMFIVLFAMSTVDAKKFEQLKDSLATGFGQVKTQKIDTASGVVVPPKHVDESGKSTDFALAQQEAQNLQRLKDQIQAALTKDGAAGCGPDEDRRARPDHRPGRHPPSSSRTAPS